MDSPIEVETPAPADKAPRSAVRLMFAILIVMALLAVYANVQRARRGKIETVEIKMIDPVGLAAPSVSP